MLSTKSIQIASYTVVIYILVAITWWAVLLYREHDALFDAYEVIQVNQLNTSDAKLENIKNMDASELTKMRKRKALMILTEALGIGLGLLIGIWIIHIGYRNIVRAEKVKKNFLLSISHELKSPIASTQLAFETLKRLKKTDEQTNLIINHGLNETNRLNGLVQNILLATRLEAGYQPDLKKTNLVESLERCIRSYEILHPSAQIKLHVDPNPLVVIIDTQAFDIIINNLIENAIKYSSNKAIITIDLKQNNNNLLLSVSDLGIGIRDEEKPRVFRRFYRIGEESKRKTKGTGLGLFLVKALIKRNNGTIFLQDNEPNGVTFLVNWPLENSNETT